MADSLLALYDLLASLTEPEWAALSPLLAPHRPYLPPDGRSPAERAAAVVQVVEQRGLERAVLEARIQEIRGRRPPSELLVAVVAVRAELDEAAQREGISINQLIASAAGEKLAAWATEEILSHRAQRGDRARFEAALQSVPDEEPAPEDR